MISNHLEPLEVKRRNQLNTFKEESFMSMTKADVVEKIHAELGLAKKDAAEVVDLLFKVIKETLSKGEKVKISGFGNFSIRDKASRMGRNPQTGDSMSIAARRVLTFRPSQILKEDITNKYEHRLNDKGVEDKTIPPKDTVARALSGHLSAFHLEEED